MVYMGLTNLVGDFKNACTGFANDLKNDERGVSGTVVAVLLVLTSVLAIAFLWGNLGTQIDNWWTDIVDPTNAINAI